MSLSRRSFFANLAATAGLPALAADKKAVLRPNIVLISVDNLASWMLGINGNRDIRTPNLDTLLRSGMRFNFAYASAPTATAALPSLLTGRTARQLGDGKKPLDSDVLLSDILAAQGYTCGYAGRWAGAEGTRPGHGYGYSSADPAVALDFLSQQKATKPFFLTLSYPLLTTTPAPQYAALYSKSTFVDSLPRHTTAPNAKDKDKLKDIIPHIRNAAAALSALDDQIGALIKALRSAGLRDNTLIILSGSAGFLMGQHGLWGDGNAADPITMYDEVTRVANCWNWPGKIPVEVVRPDVVDTQDILPTVCDLVGATVPERNLCGHSYLPLVLNKPMPKKEPWINQAYSAIADVEMIRDPRYKLVIRKAGEGINELYDLRNDPLERANLYENPQYITVRDELYGPLEAWRKKYSA